MSQRNPLCFSSEGGEYQALPTRDHSGRLNAFKRFSHDEATRLHSLKMTMSPPHNALRRMSTLTDPMRLENVFTPRMHKMSISEHPATLREKVSNFIQDARFQAAMGTLILANAIVIGLETDMTDLLAWNYMENAFLFIFTLEFIVKIAAFGFWEYFRPTNQESCWNALDFLIVLLGWFELGSEMIFKAGAKGGAQNIATLFRIVRLLRILRIFKILRFLKQLYMLAFGLALAATAVSWVTILMAFVLYVCSIILVRTVGRVEDDDPSHEILRTGFNTIPKAMFTLFNLMACPDLRPYGDIIPEFPYFGLFLIMFTIFGSFGMIALLTGVIGENMFEKNQLRAEEDRRERDERRKLLCDICDGFFDDIPIDDNGKASREMINQVIPQIKDLFESEGIVYGSHELDGMLEIMDNGDGLLSKDDVCCAVLQIAEGVRPISIIEIHYEVVECMSQLTDLKKITGTCLMHLENLNQESATSAKSSKMDDASELRSLVLEIHGEMKMIGSAVQAVAESRSVGLTEYMCQLMGLKENVDKCLGYLEEGTIAGADHDRVSSKGAITALAGLLCDLRDEEQSPRQRPRPCPRCDPTKSKGPSSIRNGGASIDTLETMARELPKADFATRVEMEEAKQNAKLNAELRCLAVRLAQGRASLPTGMQQMEGSFAVDESSASAAGQGIEGCRDGSLESTNGLASALARAGYR